MNTKTETDFATDYETGDIGVKTFLDHFKGQLISEVPYERKEEYDYKVNGTKYEIKTNFKDDGMLVIEEWNSRAENVKGWIVTSKSDFIVFVSKTTGMMLMYPTKTLQDWYRDNHDWIRTSIPLHKNKKTNGNYGDQWTGEYRRIPISKLNFRPVVVTK